MRIDLHCHTKATKNGGEGRNVTPERFAKKIDDAQVKIVAITNHNEFDKDQFEKLKEAVSDDVSVWPGVELDMDSEQNKWHLIIVGNPNDIEKFYICVSQLCDGINVDDKNFNIEKVLEVFKNCDVLFIPHSCGKRSGHEKREIPESDREHLLEKCPNQKRIIFEPHQHSLGVLSKNGYRVILGSDVKEWSEYEKCQFADLRADIVSFEAFCCLAEGNVDAYNAYVLNNNEGKVVNVRPVKNAKPRKIELFQGVNTVFGQKGTGKTKLIEALYAKLFKQGCDAVLYKAKEARTIFDKDISSEGITPNAKDVDADPCNEEFKNVMSWTEELITPFDKYVEYCKNSAATKNRTRLVIADVGREENFTKEEDLKIAESNYGHITQALKEIEKICFEDFLDSKQSKDLSDLLYALSESIDKRRKALITEKLAIRLLNFSVTNIKEQAEKRCNSPSSPNGTGFGKFAINRIEIKKCVEKILDNIDGQNTKSEEEYAYLDDKGQIKIETEWLMFKNKQSPATYFNSRKTALNDAKKLLKDISKNVLKDSLAEKIGALNDFAVEKRISSTNDFVGVRKTTVIGNDNAPYEPSDGELAIIMLKRFLKEDHEYYFLDEPELGMGNSYINSNVRGEIMSLSEKQKTVVIATHNANLAIRTMPVQSMLLEYHGKDDFAVYCGSPYSDSLISLDDENDVKKWSEKSMEILEGGREAFYDRKDMYELDKCDF